MARFELSEDVARNQIIAPLVLQTEPVLSAALGGEGPDVTAVWDFRQTGTGRRELVLRLKAGDRQTEQAFQPTELAGNGAFKERVGRMADALAHNGSWRAAVRGLMERVREWSQDLPDAKVEEDAVTLSEERSGRYQLPRLTVTSGGAVLRVEPAAEWVVNPRGVQKAGGRVDLKGPGGPLYLYLLLPAGGWVYTARDLDPAADPHLFYPLDRTSFGQLARVCLHG